MEYNKTKGYIINSFLMTEGKMFIFCNISTVCSAILHLRSDFDHMEFVLVTFHPLFFGS